MSGEVRVEPVEAGIVRLVLDHPARLNALSWAMWGRLGELIHTLDADPALRCILLTGTGERAFSTGADISEFDATRSTPEKGRAYAAHTHKALDGVRRCRHPVVAQIAGLCIGGGLELALAADLRIATTDARFGIPAKRLGLVLGWDELRGLVEVVGKAAALRILLEGDIFDAGEAQHLGLVTRLVAPADLAGEALATARRIAEGAPLTARFHKAALARLMQPHPLAPAEEEQAYTCFDTEDYRRGCEAFMAKARPSFVGR
jgi:enoyl-CoA hydratase/carnithine racemase